MFSIFLILSVSKKQCEECKSLAKVLENAVNKNVPQEQISQITLKNCENLPKVLQGKCSEFARNNIDNVLKLIKSGVPANETCTQLNFCETSDQNVDVTLDSQDGDWKEHKPSWAVSWSEDF